MPHVVTCSTRTEGSGQGSMGQAVSKSKKQKSYAAKGVNAGLSEVGKRARKGVRDGAGRGVRTVGNNHRRRITTCPSLAVKVVGNQPELEGGFLISSQANERKGIIDPTASRLTGPRHVKGRVLDHEVENYGRGTCAVVELTNRTHPEHGPALLDGVRIRIGALAGAAARAAACRFWRAPWNAAGASGSGKAWKSTQEACVTGRIICLEVEHQPDWVEVVCAAG